MELKGNRGLELPANIGDLGGTVREIDLSGHNLRGVIYLNSHTEEIEKRLVHAQDLCRR